MAGEQRIVPRPLAIEGETVAIVPDADDSRIPLDPADRPRHRNRHLGRGGPQRGLQRIFTEQVQDIGDEQFLMLLFVMTA